MPRSASCASRALHVIFLASALTFAPARAAEGPASTELARAHASAAEAADRAEALRRAGRGDLAKLAGELAEGRRVAAQELERARAAEDEAAKAEEAHAAALRELDRATAAREERRQRIARLADQLAQAEADSKEPPVVSMPKGKKGAPPKGVAVDADSGKGGAREREPKGAAEPKSAAKKGSAK
jgi:hypothetical protein